MKTLEMGSVAERSMVGSRVWFLAPGLTPGLGVGGHGNTRTL